MKPQYAVNDHIRSKTTHPISSLKGLTINKAWQQKHGTMLKASPKQQQKQGRQRGKKNRKQSIEERTKARKKHEWRIKKCQC
jgi:hypothetical protein